MASMTKHRTLVNPGAKKRRRNMSWKQKLHFGTIRQRIAAALKLKNSRKRRKNVGTILSVLPNGRRSRVRRRRNAKGSGRVISGYGSTVMNRGRRRKRRTNNGNHKIVINPARRRRRRNASSKGSGRVISGYGSTVMNKGRRRKKTMARTRNRRRRTSNRTYHRRRRRATVTNPRRRRRTRNVHYVKRMKRNLYQYTNPRRRRRSRVTNRRHYRRSRNPGMLSGGAGKVVGIIGGAAVTALLSKFIPAGLSTGFIGYITKGIVAVLQGRLVGKMSGSRALGQDFMYGGLAYVALSVMNDMFGLSLPGFGLRGMGLIAPSNFYTPQVNMPGSMGSFVRPASIPIAYVPPAGGMGNVRRGGRVR